MPEIDPRMVVFKARDETKLASMVDEVGPGDRVHLGEMFEPETKTIIAVGRDAEMAKKGTKKGGGKKC